MSTPSKFEPNDFLKNLTALRKSRDAYLKNLDREKIIHALDQVARRWLNPKDPVRKKALEILPRSTRCSKEAMAEGLNLAFREVLEKNLRAALAMLEKFPRSKLSFFIFAGIIPTPMLFDIFTALLLKSAVIAKVPSREPFFSQLLAQSIREVDPKLGSCVIARHWPGGEKDIGKTLFREADWISAYGDDETIENIQARIPPKKIFLAFGHKISLAVIAKEALKKMGPEILAERLAYDVALYDQQGCVSPHAVYLEGNAREAREWASVLAKAMKKISKKFPPGKNFLGESSAVHQMRGQYACQERTALFSSHPTPDWTVIYEENPQFRPSCLNRTIFVKPLERLEGLLKILKGWRHVVQALGCAVGQKRMLEIEAIRQKLQIPFLAPLGQMQALSLKLHLDERIKALKIRSKYSKARKSKNYILVHDREMVCSSDSFKF